MHAPELVRQSARALAASLAEGSVSASQVLEAHLTQIRRVNAGLNAIVTLDADGARAQAAAIDARRAAGERLSVYAGLPIAIKDMDAVRGMRTTFGSPIFADHIPDADSLMVERLRAQDFVILGKTNTPEFAMGSQTFNTVFGATRNPWNTGRTCGGSSGGAAVAVAARMLPLADGSDLGGSLRNPGNFNHVFGLRPSPGRVPAYSADQVFIGMGVHGPIARDAADAAFFLGALAGPDARDPLSIPEDPARFLAPLERDFRGVRVAFSPTLGGLPVEPEVRRVMLQGVERLASLGCIIDEAEPDFSGADEAFDVLRAQLLAGRLGALLPLHRARMKDTAIWNIEEGLNLAAARVLSANAARAHCYHAMRRFLETYDYLVAPVNQVPPFAIDLPYVTEIDGVHMDSYIAWMRSCTRISASAHPAASVPCGFTRDGLPVGMQLVGRYRDEFSVLQLGHAMEGAWARAREAPPGIL